MAWALALAAGAWLAAGAGQARAAGAEQKVALLDDATPNLRALEAADLRGARGAGLDAATPTSSLPGDSVAVILWDDYERARRGNGGSITLGPNVNVNSSVNR